jgi:hypothetical protein
MLPLAASRRVQLLCRLGPRAAVEVFGFHGSRVRHLPRHHGLLAERGEALGSEAAAQPRRYLCAEVSAPRLAKSSQAAGDSAHIMRPVINTLRYLSAFPVVPHPPAGRLCEEFP